MPPWICVTDTTSRKTRPSTSTSRGSASQHVLQPVERERDRVDAEPRSRRMRGAALEDDPRVQVAEATELQRVVGGLQTDHELRLVDEAASARRRRAAGSRPGRAPLAGRRAAQGRRRARPRPPSARARSSRRGRPSCPRRRARDPAVLDPAREVSLGRNGVGVARQQDERLPGAVGVDQALAVARRRSPGARLPSRTRAKPLHVSIPRRCRRARASAARARDPGLERA